jgi:hypothetical protein
MSWLSRIKSALKLDGKTVGESIAYLMKKAGKLVTDKQVDQLVAKSDKVTDQIEVALAAFIKAEVPLLPTAVATMAASAAMNVVDAAIAGAANVLRDGD